MTQKQPTKFQQMIQACTRAKKGLETGEDVLFMMTHPEMAQLIMTRIVGRSQL